MPPDRWPRRSCQVREPPQPLFLPIFPALTAVTSQTSPCPSANPSSRRVRRAAPATDVGEGPLLLGELSRSPPKVGTCQGLSWIPAPCRDLGARWLNRRINLDIKQNRVISSSYGKNFVEKLLGWRHPTPLASPATDFSRYRSSDMENTNVVPQKKNNAVPHFYHVVDGYTKRCLPSKVALLHGEPYWSNWELHSAPRGALPGMPTWSIPAGS